MYDCDYTISGLYRYGNASSGQCKPCNYPCITCSSASVCLTCTYEIENRHEPATKNTCTCKDGFY